MDLGQQYAGVAVVLCLLGATLWWLRRRGYAAGATGRKGRRLQSIERLPLVTTSVGGLVEATAGYTGAVLVPPGDAAALAEGIRTALPLVGATHTDPHSWGRTAEMYTALLDRIAAGWISARPSQAEPA